MKNIQRKANRFAVILIATLCVNAVNAAASTSNFKQRIKKVVITASAITAGAIATGAIHSHIAASGNKRISLAPPPVVGGKIIIK
jgi:hypothetical protein